jgi:hypothetical protein
MFLRNRMNDHKTVLRLGMLCLLLFSLTSWFARHPTTDFWEGVIDGARGALFGLSAGFNLWAVRLARRSRCA